MGRMVRKFWIEKKKKKKKTPQGVEVGPIKILPRDTGDVSIVAFFSLM
jgi:hypothetical protein